MRRSWRVGPDQIIDTPLGQIAVVSRQAQAEAIMDAVVACDRFGGTISVLYGRAQTGRPGEMVTPEILVTYQDRTDAKPQYEEPIAFEDPEPVFIDPPQNGHADETAAEAALAAVDQEG